MIPLSNSLVAYSGKRTRLAIERPMVRFPTVRRRRSFFKENVILILKFITPTSQGRPEEFHWFEGLPQIDSVDFYFRGMWKISLLDRLLSNPMIIQIPDKNLISYLKKIHTWLISYEIRQIDMIFFFYGSMQMNIHSFQLIK